MPTTVPTAGTSTDTNELPVDGSRSRGSVCGRNEVAWRSGRQFADGTHAGTEPFGYDVGAVGREVRLIATEGKPHALQVVEIEILEEVQE